MDNVNQIRENWDLIKETLREEYDLSDISYNTWVKPLNFNNVEDKLGWLKYIRFYRYKDNQFIVCDSQSHAIEWRLCTQENLQSEYLEHH